MELTTYTQFPEAVFEALLGALYPVELLPQKKMEGVNKAFFQSALVVMEQGAPLAACCLYLNPDLKYNGQSAMALGNFESYNRPDAVQLLVTEAARSAKAQGASVLLGPMNGSTWDTYRLGLANFYPPFFLEPFYQGYYPGLLTASGFQPVARYVSQIDRGAELNDVRIARAEQQFEQQGIRIRPIDLQHYGQELVRLHAFCMESFKSNFLFTPISQEAFVEKYLRVKPYIDPAYVLIAEDAQQQVAGFIFCLPNFSDKNEKGLIVKTLGKRPSLRYGGMGNVLGTSVKQRALANGYTYLIHAFMIESNASRSLSNHFAPQPLREYFLYSLSI